MESRRFLLLRMGKYYNIIKEQKGNKMKPVSQDMIVLRHMQKHQSITSMDAFTEYGITRLSAKIYNLRQDGHKIGMVWEESVNRYGVPVRYGRYFIEKNKGGIK